MKITGPLRIGILDNDMGGREIHLDFNADFRALNLQQQTETFQQFLAQLANDIAALAEDSPDRKGAMTIHQICEQIMPHIENNEIPLEETIVVSFQADNPFGNITIQQ